MDLNEEEKTLCKQLRDRTRDLDIMDNFRIMDFNMIRFLRARNMDIDKAEDMFRKYIDWREENDVDNAKTWDVAQDLKTNFRYRLTGLTQNGGLGIRALITLLKAFEAYYPETLKRAYLVSAPWLFSILWSICKPFISTATHERLRFLGSSDKEVWKAEITQHVNADQFPVSFGGTLPEDVELYLDEDGTVKQKRCDDQMNIMNNKNNKGHGDSSTQKPVDSIELD